jgi:hypothetical protein
MAKTSDRRARVGGLTLSLGLIVLILVLAWTAWSGSHQAVRRLALNTPEAPELPFTGPGAPRLPAAPSPTPR